jgi:hypothetical protein
MARGKKIDDKTREQIKAVFASCGNMRETARRCNVSPSTVKKVIEEDPDEIEQLRTEKKKEWIAEAWSAIRLHMKNLLDPEKARKNHQRDSAIIIGTLIDKLNAFEEMALKREELQLKREELEKKDEDGSGDLMNLIDALDRARRRFDGD